MSMDLRDALESVERTLVRSEPLDREALRIVFVAASENHAAKLIAEVNALSARALALETPHAFVPGGPEHPGSICAKCWSPKDGRIHSVAATP